MENDSNLEIWKGAFHNNFLFYDVGYPPWWNYLRLKTLTKHAFLCKFEQKSEKN